MAKRRHEQPEPLSSRTTLIILAIGGLLAAGLVGWALTRTVETPAPAAEPPQVAGFEQTGATPTPVTDTSMTVTTPPPPAATGSLDGSAVMDSAAAVPRIAAEDLKAKAARGEVTIIDVRDDASYASGHIPGALHIPLARIEGEMGTLSKSKPIVTYCT